MTEKTGQKNKVIIFKNKEKEFHEQWNKDRNLANFPHPFRCVILGPPNSGKTNLVHNLIKYQNPPFRRIYLMHPDPENKEYCDVEHKYIKEVPDKKFFNERRKNLLIIDDNELKNLKKDKIEQVNKLFSYVSTHKNVSIIITSQDVTTQLFVSIPRMSNIFIIFKYFNHDTIYNISRKIGVGKKQLYLMCLDNLDTIHDSLCFDRTLDTPYPLRKNLFTNIKNLEY